MVSAINVLLVSVMPGGRAYGQASVVWGLPSRFEDSVDVVFHHPQHGWVRVAYHIDVEEYAFIPSGLEGWHVPAVRVLEDGQVSLYHRAVRGRLHIWINPTLLKLCAWPKE